MENLKKFEEQEGPMRFLREHQHDKGKDRFCHSSTGNSRNALMKFTHETWRNHALQRRSATQQCLKGLDLCLC